MSVLNIAFIITSVINTISSNLTYGVRSYYTDVERFQQTLNTIHSIRHFVPGSVIYLIEGSHINSNHEFILESLVNYYKNVHDIFYVKKGIDSRLKGYGEAVQLKYVFDNYNMYIYDYIFKISGRYNLNEHFDLESLIPTDKITFCKGKSIQPPIVSTVLFMIPNTKINLFINTYNNIYELYREYDKKLLRGSSLSLHYERIIPEILHTYRVINKIGVEGLVSSYRTFYKC